MKKLNRRGYMTIEIILASVITFVIAFFLIDLTIKLVNTTDDAYADTVLTTDKALVIKNIKKYLEKDICDNGGISEVRCSDRGGNCTIIMNNDNEIELFAIKNLIEYDNGSEYYSNKIDDSLSNVTISSTNRNGYYNFKISGTNIFLEEDYDMNIFIYNRCNN